MVTVVQVDAFTEIPFAGNPAAVCLVSEPVEAEWMQRVAGEMNLGATAFAETRPDGSFGLRWFSPRVELTLCGHGTLSAAHVLWEEGVVDPNQEIAFHTLAGILTAVCDEPWIQLDFPAERERPEADPPAQLLPALGVASAVHVGRNRLDYLVELESAEAVRQLAPDLSLLANVPARGVIVTARSSGDHDFVSRYFAPAIGIDEDHATGSAHCCLGPYWGPRLGKDEMLAYQASPRGGVVRVGLDGDRVRLGGMAVTVLRGHLV